MSNHIHINKLCKIIMCFPNVFTRTPLFNISSFISMQFERQTQSNPLQKFLAFPIPALIGFAHRCFAQEKKQLEICPLFWVCHKQVSDHRKLLAKVRIKTFLYWSICIDFDFQYEDFDQTRIPVLTKAVFFVFAILVPILLLNMLIAMMGNTYSQVIARSEKEWKRQVIDFKTYLKNQLICFTSHHPCSLVFDDFRNLINNSCVKTPEAPWKLSSHKGIQTLLCVRHFIRLNTSKAFRIPHSGAVMKKNFQF